MAAPSTLYRFFFLAMVLLLGAMPLLAADDAGGEEAQPQPQTTGNPGIPLQQLRLMVRPLTKAELEVEAKAWFELLREKAGEIAKTQLTVKQANGTSTTQTNSEASEESADSPESTDESTAAADSAAQDKAAGDTLAAENKQELLQSVSQLQDQRTALADRLQVVLNSLEAKGGDVEEYRKYMTAVAGLELDTEDAGAAWAAIAGWLTSKEGGQRWAWNIAKFLLILLISYLVAKCIAAVTNWLLERKLKMSQLAENLISRTIKNVVMLIGLAIALTALEVDVTPILAAIGAAGFIIGFALQGTLSNFASGLMILVNRPFDVGDVVSAGGVTGVVDQMNLVSTRFKTFDNQTIYVPNNEIWGNVITNITANDQRRVDMEFGVGYDDDFEQAEQIIREVVESHELVLDDPEPAVVMHELADSSVNIVCRPWAKTSDWWTVKTDVTRQVKQRFDQAGISIPYPQTDIHVYEHANSSK